MRSFSAALGALFVAGLSLAAGAVHAQGAIKIGEINSYKAQPAFLGPYKKGMELAVAEVNSAGGIQGRKLELVVRDDNGNPGDAVRAADELLAREKVDVLMGSFLSHVGLALTDFAKQKKVFFLAAEPLTDKIVWENGNRYTFRLRASTYMQTTMLVPEAATQRHLEILSEIAEMLSDRDLRERLLHEPDAAAVHQLIADWPPQKSAA